MQETQAIDDYTSWFCNYYGIGNANEDLDSVFDICYRYPVSDPDSPPEQTVYQHQPRRESEYDIDFRYWLSEYDSCCGGYWGDDLFSGRYGVVVDGCNDPVVKTEDQYQSYTSYCENLINTLKVMILTATLKTNQVLFMDTALTKAVFVMASLVTSLVCFGSNNSSTTCNGEIINSPESSLDSRNHCSLLKILNFYAQISVTVCSIFILHNHSFSYNAFEFLQISR